MSAIMSLIPVAFPWPARAFRPATLVSRDGPCVRRLQR